MEDTLMTAVGGEGEDTMLPDGFSDGDDFFNPDSWSGQAGEEETADSSAGDDALTMGNEEGGEEQSAEEEAGEPSGQTEEPEAKSSRKLKLKVNHAEEEIDIDAMSDEELTALLQKGRAFDAMKDSENKQRYRRIYQEQIDAGMTEAVARMVAQSEAGGKSYSLEDAVEPAHEAPVTQPKETAPVRDFKAEYEQLLARYPEVKQLPDEVVKVAAAKDVSLLNAYMVYREEQSSKAASSLKKENAVLRQNAAAAAKAPVKGVSGGGQAQTKVDPMLAAFDADEW